MALLDVLGELLVEDFGALGVLALQAQEAVLVREDVRDLRGEHLRRVVGELLPGAVARVETVQRPVPRVDRGLHLVDPVAAVDAVLDAGRVADDDRRSVVRLGFDERLQRLRLIGVDGDLSDVDVLVGHEELSELLLVGALAARLELVHAAHGRRLRLLTARVRVDLRVEDEHLDVGAGAQHVVQPAKVDVRRPPVAADRPEGELRQQILAVEECLDEREVLVLLEDRDEFLRRRGALDSVMCRFLPVGEGGDNFGGHLLALQRLFDAGEEDVAALGDSLVRAEDELGGVLEERVCRCGSALGGLVDGVRVPAERERVRDIAPGSARDDCTLANELGEQLDVARLAASRTGTRELEHRADEL